ncbi:alkaline phosphatase [Polaribacter sp. Z014]|uniref:alkaline phosphatase n=1 Tax=unclassified Polaribacter TaxID=196858 RepID=UPI00193B5888|nr:MULTISPECIES: alkaline phosphatase [unclassified Polaribacter]MCL7764731.1 alkaline phosphatase [Polaribacter sp. Z014]QVY64076.1 alkaline phosphatase [Polaribacter sp. Q13]
MMIISMALFCAIGYGQTKQNAKYVFLFIGDGMGVSQVYTTEMYLNAKPNEIKTEKLLMSSFPVNSNMTNYSASSYVTTSCSAATAMSTGFKTANGIIGKSPDKKIAYENISQKVKKAGFKVGILSSVMIDHATPASFYAHQDSRNMYYEISMELPNYNIDYFGGGGFHHPKGKKGDQPDSFENAIKKGYTIADSHEEFNKLKNGDEKIIAINPEKYPTGEFYWAIDKKEDALSLADFTKKGIEVIDNDKGFFMMVEGGKIDWACHGNDGVSMVHEVLAFNDAIKEAFEFYKKRPDETLIIVTADHETGALSTGINYVTNPELLKYQIISVQEFKRKMTELKNTDPKVSFNTILELVQADFGLGNKDIGLSLDDKELTLLKSAYNKQFKGHKEVNADADYLSKTKTKSIAETAAYILNKKAGIRWGSGDHSGTPVPVRVIGKGQEEFSEYFDNTDLPKKILKLMGI